MAYAKHADASVRQVEPTRGAVLASLHLQVSYRLAYSSTMLTPSALARRRLTAAMLCFPEAPQLPRTAFEYLVMRCLSTAGDGGEVMGAVLWSWEGTILKAPNVDEFCSALADHCMLT